MKDIEEKRKRIRIQNQRAHERRSTSELTKADVQIINLIYEEKTTQEIAEILGKSKRTIDSIRLYIIRKIGCKNVVGVIKYAIAHKLVAAPTKRKRV